MNALDIILGFVMIVIVALQTFRGFGRALFDGLGLYCVLLISSAVAAASTNLHITASAAGTQTFMFVITFVVTGILAVFVSRWVYGTVLLNLGMFEHLMGLVAGVACALIVAHGIVQAIDLDTQGTTGPNIIASSSIGQECLTFDSYHSFVDGLYSATAGHDSNPASPGPG
jgi:hypothetical protein